MADEKMRIRKVLSYFYKIVWREKPYYYVYLGITVLTTAALPFVNIVFPKYLIDELLGSRDIRAVLTLVICIIGLNLLLKGLCQVFTHEVYKLNDWFYRYFSLQVSRKSMEMDFSYTEDPDVLNQRNKADNGMWFYSGGLQGLNTCITTLLSSTITILGVAVIIATASPLLFVVALVAVTVGALVVKQINKLEIATFNKGPQINRAFGYIFMELCQARYGKDVRLYQAKEKLMDMGRVNLHELYVIYKELHEGTMRWGYANALISAVKNGCIYLYLGYMAWLRRITVGDFMMLVTAANSFKDSLQAIITQMQELQKKANFMNEYVVFMEYEDNLKKGEKTAGDADGYTVEFRSVSFRYPRTNDYVLKDINLTIHKGEHLSIVGLNGAGKTTFIKLLCRLYDVTEGSILLNGLDIREYEYKKYMELLSVVFQDFKLFSTSIDENIRLGSWEKDKTDLSQLLKVCKMEEKVESLPCKTDTMLYKMFDQNAIEPSGGEAQKLAIARALYKDAPIVILDEPTAALDPIAEYEVYKQFDQLVGGKTAVYISHRLSSCKFCDKIAVFAQNTVTEYGTHEELVKKENGIYAEMFRVQAQYYVS